MTALRLISFVFPIFNEEDSIPELYERVTATIATRDDFDAELIFVNDGSRDKSLAALLERQATDDRMRVIDFSRNFGHQIAVTAGLDFARGDAAIIMDSDLQDPPAVALELIDAWRDGYDVVYAQRRGRKDGWFKRLTAAVFYRVLRLLADIDIPRDTGDFRLIDRKVIDALGAMREHHRFLRGMVSFVGFRQTAVLFDRDERFAGTTGYPFRKMVQFASDGIMGFSTVPLKLISRVGYAVSFVAFIGIVYALVVRLFLPETVIEGWTFTIISVLAIGGVQMVMTGLLGGYIARIFSEVQGRPLYLVAGAYGLHPEPFPRESR